MQRALISWAECAQKVQTKPKVTTEYVPTLATWAVVQAIVEIFEANLKYAAK